MLKNFNDANKLSLVLIGLMFFVPFTSVHHMPPLPSFYAEWLAGATGLAAIIAVVCLAKPAEIRIPRVAFVFFGLSLIVILQLLANIVETQHALLVLSYLVWAFFLTWLGSYLRQIYTWQGFVPILAWGLLAAGIVNIMFAILQIVVKTGGSIPFMPLLASFGTLAQSNHAANLDALATISLIYLHTSRRLSASAFGLLLVLLMSLLSISGSRSVWLYLIAITAISAYMYFLSPNSKNQAAVKRKVLLASLLLVPMFIIAQLVIYYGTPTEQVNLPAERVLQSIVANSQSLRLQIWYDSLRLFFGNPWLGVGAGGIRENAFMLLGDPATMASKLIFEHAHNLFLHLLTEYGIVAFVLLSYFLFQWVKTFQWRQLNLETWWLICLLLVLGIHSMLEYPLWYAYFLGITAILFGAGEQCLVSANSLGKLIKSKLSYQTGRILIIFTLLLGVLNLGTLYIANIKLEEQLQAMLNNKTDNGTRQKSVEFSLLSPYSKFLIAHDMPINANHIETKLELNRSAMRLRPIRKIVYQHAVLLHLRGDRSMALKQLQLALIAYPDGYLEFLSELNPSLRKDFMGLIFTLKPELRGTINRSNQSLINSLLVHKHSIQTALK